MLVHVLSVAIHGNNDTDGVLGSAIGVFTTLEAAKTAAAASFADCVGDLDDYTDDLREDLVWNEVAEGAAIWEAGTADEEFTYRITTMDLVD